MPDLIALINCQNRLESNVTAGGELRVLYLQKLFGLDDAVLILVDFANEHAEFVVADVAVRRLERRT